MFSQNQIATIQIGPKATQLGAAYHYLESQQFFDEEFEKQNNILHESLFQDYKSDIVVPRTLLFSFRGEIEALNYISVTKIKEDKKNVNKHSENFDPMNPYDSLMQKENMRKLEHIQHETNFQKYALENNKFFHENNDKDLKKKIEKEKLKLQMEEDEKRKKALLNDNPYYDYVNQCMPKQKYMHELYKTYENDFHAYTSGKNSFLEKQEDKDQIDDKIRLLLEENDYLNGFQIFADTDSGFGSFTNYILEVLHEECAKKAKFTIALTDKLNLINNSQAPQYLQSVLAMNDLLIQTELREKSSLLVPIDLNFINKCQYFNQDFINKSEFNRMTALSLLVSNITLPYRLKGNQGMDNIFNSILPYRDLNIFSLIAQIPLVNSDETILDDKKHIIKYRENIRQHQSSLSTAIFNGNLASFGESYTLRGPVKMPKGHKFDNKFDLKVTDQIIATPQFMPPILCREIIKFYTPEEHEEWHENEDEREKFKHKTSEKIKNVSNIEAFPMHSVLFSHESLKYVLKNNINLYKTGDINANLRFQEDDFSREELMEVINNAEQVFDNYTFSKQDHDEGDDESDE
ncbi:Tubulin/FtsZ, GTPase domain [Pseudocohnilembus persalinus]|uniref:Tubulin/FtsZ, GTPase domain n=1 Tax=Pseudocohnilembus persalinus TaxID=266149 RepID=A0A0V0QCH0_PSEPJ|nr:Tubulin/FtsZ, GTPase domain [Pseudocohnilembus persalinus]|eukprot:KRW99929.1 Tubulin/FtsZ, GTPase domain [Pseudocohnilembus persalinus]